MTRPLHATGPTTSRADSVILTPLGVAGLLLRRWRLVALLPLAAAIAAGAFALLLREYTARARFLPQTSHGQLARFAGIASQIGFDLAPEGVAESPDFYVELVGSGEILREAVLREYRFARAPASADTLEGNYLDLLRIGGDTPDDRLQAGIDRLRENVAASASVKSGVVTLRTTAPWPGMAEALNASILEELSRFDRERRQAGAQAERMFVEGRLAEAKQELEETEAALATFLDRNKRPESSRLMMELEQHQRQVALRQQLYATLAQAYEQARIEEVRNTPVLTIVDRPEGSARGRRSPLLLALLGGLFGFVAALGIGIALDYLDGRTGSREMEQFREVIRTMRRPAHTTGDAA